MANRQLVVQALMRALQMELVNELSDHVVQVPLAENDEEMQAFILIVWVNRSTNATVFGERQGGTGSASAVPRTRPQFSKGSNRIGNQSLIGCD